tara:strand:+ start:46138 stop:46479 length:342 start_codon:yes stop_codon:yes gene_type:complete
MSDKKIKNSEKTEKTFEEKVLDNFPEDFKPDYKPQSFDPLNDSGKKIIEQTGAKDIFKKLMIEESDKVGFDLFWDALVDKKAKDFERLRETLLDDNIRRELLKKIIEVAKHGK